jgi:toxin ParE1/3/4
MSINVVRTTGSRLDLRRILDYFLSQNEPTVATRFLAAFEETLQWIADFPELGGPWESDVARLKDLRVKPIQGFEKYLIFYRVTERGAMIMRLFHGHQDIENSL